MMGVVYDKILWKIRSDATGSGGGWALAPQTGLVSPEGVIDSRQIGDRYVNTFTSVEYRNPNASGNTGWQLVQSI